MIETSRPFIFLFFIKLAGWGCVKKARLSACYLCRRGSACVPVNNSSSNDFYMKLLSPFDGSAVPGNFFFFFFFFCA